MKERMELTKSILYNSLSAEMNYILLSVMNQYWSYYLIVILPYWTFSHIEFQGQANYKCH